MKHLYSVILLPVLLVLLIAGCALNSFPPVASLKAESTDGQANIPDSKEWEHLGKTRTGECYYKVTGTDDTTGIITISTYKIVNDDHRKSTIEKLQKSHPGLSEKYENFNHSIRVDEIDCKNKRYRMKEVVDYDNKGQVLCVNPHNSQEWYRIPILTGLDKLRMKLCAPEIKKAEPKKPSKKKKKR
ncbi:MAG: hypothetical protein PHN98_06620 [Smithellaceae bacterium]|nr:hypothetical protein [Smithellaceae bacterium]